jgi:hypothetical protein
MYVYCLYIQTNVVRETINNLEFPLGITQQPRTNLLCKLHTFNVTNMKSTNSIYHKQNRSLALGLSYMQIVFLKQYAMICNIHTTVFGGKCDFPS